MEQHVCRNLEISVYDEVLTVFSALAAQERELERQQIQMQQISGAALDILLVLLLFSTVTAALFSMAAFSAVFPLLLAALAIKAGLYALYSRACA